MDHLEPKNLEFPLSRIHPGLNYRKYFDPAEMAELEESIRAVGVIQPITVRPKGDDWEIIAGERRYRAALTVYGDTGVIPVLVRNMADDEARAAALVENTLRANTSPTEDADAIQYFVLKNKGDVKGAAKELGWPLSKAYQRLALLQCTEKVRDALTHRRILLGHAELLAAVPKEKQDTALDRILANNITVAVLRTQLASISHDLSAAIFDKSDCGNCPSNSTVQGQMFTETVASGHCTNPLCYRSKLDVALAKIADDQRENFPRVEILKADAVLSVIPVVADGTVGVGEEQMSACRGCGNFGCTVSALPGHEGHIESNLCFDEACHAGKVVAWAKVKQPNESPSTTGTKTAASSKPKTKSKATVNASATPQKVKDYRIKVWKSALEKEVVKSPLIAGSVLVALACSGNARCISASRMNSRFAGSLQKTAEVALGMDSKGLSKILTEIPASAVQDLAEGDVRGLLASLKVNLAEHWHINEEFLTLLTKSEIEALTDEIGLKTAVDEKAYKKALSGKKDEVIAALLKMEGFDFHGAIPATMDFTSTPANSIMALTVDEQSLGEQEVDESGEECTSSCGDE